MEVLADQPVFKLWMKTVKIFIRLGLNSSMAIKTSPPQQSSHLLTALPALIYTPGAREVLW